MSPCSAVVCRVGFFGLDCQTFEVAEALCLLYEGRWTVLTARNVGLTVVRWSFFIAVAICVPSMVEGNLSSMLQ